MERSTHTVAVLQMEEHLVDVTTEKIKEKPEKSDSVDIITNETLNCTPDKNTDREW